MCLLCSSTEHTWLWLFSEQISLSKHSFLLLYQFYIIVLYYSKENLIQCMICTCTAHLIMCLFFHSVLFKFRPNMAHSQENLIPCMIFTCMVHFRACCSFSMLLFHISVHVAHLIMCLFLHSVLFKFRPNTAHLFQWYTSNSQFHIHCSRFIEVLIFLLILENF